MQAFKRCRALCKTRHRRWSDCPEEIEAERRRQVEEQTNTQVLDVFARSRNMQASSSTSENNSDIQGAPGSTEGNATQGKTTGVGGYGSWDLNGRDMIGELPRPAYEGIQAEGRVVVAITVSPNGDVISTSIVVSRSSKDHTNTIDPQLRKIAEEAARKAKFNPTDAVNNQTGSIVYYFKNI